MRLTLAIVGVFLGSLAAFPRSIPAQSWCCYMGAPYVDTRQNCTPDFGTTYPCKFYVTRRWNVSWAVGANTQVKLKGSGEAWYPTQTPPPTLTCEPEFIVDIASYGNCGNRFTAIARSYIRVGTNSCAVYSNFGVDKYRNCDEEECSPFRITPPEPAPCPPSPIILDLDNDGYDFTSAAGGVGFDLTCDGAPEQTAWPTASADDAWLALDRSGDDSINDGQELFGDHTIQPVVAIPNGFLALAEWDKTQYGGNADGLITSADLIFPRLRLWQDANHDGLSASTELYTLSSRGVTVINLTYYSSPNTDVHGNVFKYVAFCTVNGATRKLYDVYPVTQ